MATYAYDMGHQGLLDAMAHAAAETGISGSGLVIDPAAPFHREEYHYLRGVVLARLEGQEPPVRRGDQVVYEDERPSDTFHSENQSGHRRKTLGDTGPYIVYRVWYLGDGKWALSFEGSHEWRFDNSKFKKVELEDVSIAG